MVRIVVKQVKLFELRLAQAPTQIISIMHPMCFLLRRIVLRIENQRVTSGGTVRNWIISGSSAVWAGFGVGEKRTDDRAKAARSPGWFARCARTQTDRCSD